MYAVAFVNSGNYFPERYLVLRSSVMYCKVRHNPNELSYLALGEMHWRTFERLKAKHDAFENVSLARMAQQFGLMNRRLENLGLDPLDGMGWDG